MHPIDTLAMIRAEIIEQRTALVVKPQPRAAAARPKPKAKPAEKAKLANRDEARDGLT